MSEDSGELDDLDILREIETKINASSPDKQEQAIGLILAQATCLVDQILPDDLQEVFRTLNDPHSIPEEKRLAFYQFLQSARGRDVLQRMRDAIDDFLNP